MSIKSTIKKVASKVKSAISKLPTQTASVNKATTPFKSSLPTPKPLNGLSSGKVSAPVISNKFIGPVKPTSTKAVATSGALVNQPSLPAGFYPQKPTTKSGSSGGSSGGSFQGPEINNITGASTFSLRESGSTSPITFGQTNNVQTGTGTNGTTTTINNANLRNTTDINLPEKIIPDYSQIIPPIIDTTQQLQETKDRDTALQDYLDTLNDRPNQAELYKKAQEETGILQKQQLVNDLTGTLNGIVNRGQANQLALVGQGRGIPEAIIGGQQAEIARETAIQALPVQAQLSAAQGNLDMAEQNLETLFKIYSDDAQNEFEYKRDVKKALYDYATETEKRALEKLDKKEERAYNEKQKLIETNKNIAIESAKNGAPSNVLAKIGQATTFEEAIVAAGQYLATANTDVVKLDNGNTVVIDKRTGKVISNLGGGSTPSSVQRTVNGVPVQGYTLSEGDDPYFIAQQFGIEMDTLSALNPTIKDWRKVPVGATINVPIAEEDSFIQKLKNTEGGKSLTDTSIQKLDKGLTVLNQLGVLQNNIKGVKTGPIVGAFKSANPWDTQGQTIKAQLNSIVPNLARGVYGEVGVLTDNDIRTYSQTIPNLKSTEEIRNAILYITLDMIGKSIKNTLSVNASAGRDVSGFVDIYTEMENTKNSILGTIPNAQIPQAFNNSDDTFLNQFSGLDTSISNSSFFSQY